ncbi:hypothetical protein [Gynuella sunshinyii]|uniref:Anti-sigma-K factor rskA n=1 Tax=Gynuella sunshinyii YC6258 TaxID=1445510 RepID=A0A0C5VPK3_9GAMM|nr:hypothetical protein [Gynuella sunshinyii]AJQ96577.1 hypothetical protein YC6258_04545 [Gynuella sunshinyii YC6258]
MHESLRYQHPVVRRHLASQYVLGSQSARVRRRFERLMQEDTELLAEVYKWQQVLTGLADTIPPKKAPEQVWKNLSAQIDPAPSQPSPSPTQRWSGLFSIWQLTTAVLVVLVATLLYIKPAEIQVGADYIALMDSDDADANPELLISAYLSNGQQPSRLQFEWNDRTPRTNIEGLTLFAIDKDSGAITNLGRIGDISRPMLMEKSQWAALKNSSELIIATGNDPSQGQIFRGPCVQIAQSG